MATKAQRAANLNIARKRVEEIRHNMIAIEREQGLLLADLVWNEMKAWEIKATLEGENPSQPVDGELRVHLLTLLEEIARVARWEVSADRDLRSYGDELSTLLDDFPTLHDELEGVESLLRKPELANIARAAAIDLELEVNAATGS